MMKVSKVVFLISIVTSFFSTFSLSQTYAKVDSIALSVKNKRYKTIENLVSDLTQNLETDEEKYRVFYTYITETFSYTYSYINPKKCLSSKKGNCETIANLYKEMCQISNLKCEKVDGYIRDANRLKGFFVFLRKPTHAWNIIELNNKKAIVDAAWGLSKTVGVHSSKIVERGNLDFFFNAPPKLFSLTHYPKNKKWLLTKTSKLEFVKQVGVYSDFHKIHESILAFPSKLNQKKELISFTFSQDLIADNFKIMYDDDKKSISPTEISRKDTTNFTLIFDISKIKRNEYFEVVYHFSNNDDTVSLRALLKYRKK